MSDVRPHKETLLPAASVTTEFTERVIGTWLPTYCHDPKRNYPLDGFRTSSIVVSEVDARDCIYAIERNVVVDQGGGRYRAARSMAFEPLFWEGLRDSVPRPITLWLEPVITFAALARLHRDHGWPKELLGTQPRTWAFDLVAHAPSNPSSSRILGEVKKSIREAESLLDDLRCLSSGGSEAAIRDNSLKKWKGLLDTKPPVLWIVGPSGYSKVMTIAYPAKGSAVLCEATSSALNYNAA